MLPDLQHASAPRWLERLHLPVPGRRPRPIRLRLGGGELHCHSAVELEFALDGRTAVPAEKFAEILQLDGPALEREAAAIARVEKQFKTLVEHCVAEPHSIGARLHELGAKTFSKDHDWRGIAKAVAALGPQHDDCKQILLVKYRQYLAARRELLTMVHAAVTGREAAVDTDWERGREAEAPAPQLATLALQAAELTAEDEHDRLVNAYARLPHGQPVLLRVADGEDTEILLARHRFRLRRSGGIHLLDEADRDYLIDENERRAGRRQDNDIVVDNAYRCVSRTHFLARRVDDDLLRITDTSSYGTFVPPDALVE